MKYLQNKLIPPLEMNKPTPILNQILQQLRSNHALRYKSLELKERKKKGMDYIILFFFSCSINSL